MRNTELLPRQKLLKINEKLSKQNIELKSANLKNARYFLYLENKNKALKRENYIHMRDKAELQDKLFAIELFDTIKQIGDSEKNAVDRW